MELKKAVNMSIVLAGTGIIFILMMFFVSAPEDQNALLFAGTVSLFASLFFRQLSDDDNGKGEK